MNPKETTETTKEKQEEQKEVKEEQKPLSGTDLNGVSGGRINPRYVPIK